MTLQYRSGEGSADGRSATVGIEGPDGDDALRISVNQPSIREGLALRIVPPPLDTDGDGITDPIDVCPAVPDPDQRDRDGDGFGNACDSVDGPLQASKLRIRRSTSDSRPNGRVLLDAEFLRRGPDDSTDLADGLTLRITDGLQLDQLIEWSAGECKLTERGTTRCRRAVPPHHTAELRPLPSDIPDVQANLVQVRLAGLELNAPFVPPFNVTLTNDPSEPGRGIDRTGVVASCSTKPYGINCVPASS
jgi:hypothetical protein